MTNNSNLYSHFENYFSKNCIDFTRNDIYIDENEFFFINSDKFRQILNLSELKYSIKNFHGVEYLSFSNCIDCIKNIRNYETIKFGIAIGFYGFQEFRDYKLVHVKNQEIQINSQCLFEYSITHLIKNKYPDEKIYREINILDKFNIPNIENKKNLYRIDILLEKSNIIIEYDEDHHKNPKQKKIDKEKDILIDYLGYDILRCSKTNLKESNIISFLKKLDEKINENLLRDDPQNFKEYCLFIFQKKINLDIDEDILKILTEETCEDVMNGCECEEIGRKIKNLSLNDIILRFLDLDSDDIDSKDDIETIIDLIENCGEPYETKNNDYILSHRAFELVIMSLDENIFEKSKIIKRILQEIKILYIKYLHDNNLKIIHQKNKRRQLIPAVINIGVETGKLENIEYVKKIQKKNKKLEAENEEFKLELKKKLPNNKRGLIRKNLICIDNNTNLVIGKSIVAEIPQLVYCPNELTVIDDKLKAKFDLNKLKYKIKKSFNIVINDIFERLGVDEILNNSKNNITKDLIFNTMYIEEYNRKYEINEISNEIHNYAENGDINCDSDDDDYF